MLILVTSDWISPVAISKSSNLLVLSVAQAFLALVTVLPHWPWGTEITGFFFWPHSCPKDECCLFLPHGQAFCMFMPPEDASLPRNALCEWQQFGVPSNFRDYWHCWVQRSPNPWVWPFTSLQGNGKCHRWQEHEPTDSCFLLNAFFIGL